jgi:hypothetical protein
VAEWNLDTLIRLIVVHGAEVGEDNDGQIVIYTGYRESEDGSLVKMED